MARRGQHGGRGPSQRQLKVGETVRHAIAGGLIRGEIHGLERIEVTVTEARMSPDLRHARVFVTVLGGGDAGPALEALNRARGGFRKLLAREVNLKFTPDLRFEADGSFDYAASIDRLLADPKVARDLHPEDDDGA